MGLDVFSAGSILFDFAASSYINHIDIEVGLTSRQLLAAGAKVMATDFDSKQLAEMQGDSGAMRCE